MQASQPEKTKRHVLAVGRVLVKRGFVKKDGGLKRCARRSFDEAGSNVLVNRQDHLIFLL